MTLLSICTAACNVAPVAPPATIIGNTEQTATLLLALANQAGQALMRRPQGGWVASIREYDFTTNAIETQGGSIDNSGAGGVAVISGLGDTAAVVADAWIATGTGVPKNAVITAKTASTVTINQPSTLDEETGGEYTLGQSDYILPSDFNRPIDNTFWDRSLYWQMRGPLSPQQWQFYKSSALGTATVQRRFRFRRIGGVIRLSIDPVPLVDDVKLVFEYVSTAYCESSLGVARTSWQADTDVGILDEYLLQLGIQWRLLRRLGLSYNEELSEYEREVDKAVATDGGSTTLNLTPGSYLSLIGPWSIPETGFGGGADGGGGFIIGVSGIGVGSI